MTPTLYRLESVVVSVLYDPEVRSGAGREYKYSKCSCLFLFNSQARVCDAAADIASFPAP